MQNTMRAHSAGHISMEGGVDVNKGLHIHVLYNENDLIYKTLNYTHFSSSEYIKLEKVTTYKP